jgi:hypothetical protein
MDQWWLWLVVAAIPLVQGLYWVLLVRMDNRERARTHVPPGSGRLLMFLIFMAVNFICNLALLAFTLAHICGAVGATFAWVPLDLSPRNWFTMFVGTGMLLFGFELIIIAAGALVELGAAVGFVRFPHGPLRRRPKLSP